MQFYELVLLVMCILGIIDCTVITINYHLKPRISSKFCQLVSIVTSVFLVICSLTTVYLTRNFFGIISAIVYILAFIIRIISFCKLIKKSHTEKSIQIMATEETLTSIIYFGHSSK